MIFRILLVWGILGICLLTAGGVVGIWSENDITDDVDKVAQTLALLGAVASLTGFFGLFIQQIALEG